MARRPRDVVNATGAWIAEALAEDGFGWLVKSREVRREVGGLVHRIALRGSAFNRTGHPVWISTYVAVLDPAVRRWRLANPTITGPANDDLVCAHLLGYASGRANGYVYGDASDGDIHLAEPAGRIGCLERFVAVVREAVLPWFTEASDPDSIVGSRAGDYTSNPVALLEWLAYRGRIDLIHRNAERCRRRHPGTDQRWTDGVAAARAGHPYPPGGDTLAQVAWSTTMLTTHTATAAEAWNDRAPTPQVLPAGQPS